MMIIILKLILIFASITVAFLAFYAIIKKPNIKQKKIITDLEIKLKKTKEQLNELRSIKGLKFHMISRYYKKYDDVDSVNILLDIIDTEFEIKKISKKISVLKG